MSNPIQLNLTEDNELSFEISIEGNTTKESIDKSIIRFQLEETDKKSVSYTFPVSKTKDGSLTVLIPRMDHVIKEDKSYTGNLEVIISGQYFVPQTVDISFIKPLKIESKGVVVNGHKEKVLSETHQQQPGRPVVSAKISSTNQSASQKEKPYQKKITDYTPEQQLRIRQELLRMKKLKEQKASKEEEQDFSFEFILKE